MKLFLDTNILSEYLCNRKHAATVEKILLCVEKGEIEGCVSVGSFYTLTYLIDVELKRGKQLYNPERLILLRNILKRILLQYQLVATTDLLLAVSDEQFTDLEDSYQYHTALFAQCDFFITLNEKDFRSANQANIRIMTPEQFASEFLP